MNTDWWQQFDSTTDEVERKRRSYVVLFISYAACIIILMFAFRNLSEANIELRILLFTASALMLGNAIYFHIRKRLAITSAMVTLFLVGFSVYLTVNGGYRGTALYWIFPMPMGFFIMLGHRLGLAVSIILYAVLAFAIYEPELAGDIYRAEEKSRFLASLFTVIIMSFIGEYFRNRSHLEMSNINQEKQKQANTDTLTGLPNRRFLDSVYFPQLRTKEDESYPLTLIMGDIDYFKRINDTYGHLLGDKVLKHVSKQIRASLRGEDIAARVGGEEFLIVLTHTQLSIGLTIAEKVRKHIEDNPFHHEGQTLNVTMSFGVANALSEGEMNDAMARADKQLYVAKEAGRNQVA